MQVVQTHLIRKTEHGEVHCKCWLEWHPRVRAGSVVTLEGSDERWRVLSWGSAQDSGEINRKWGLDLPKTQRLER